MDQKTKKPTIKKPHPVTARASKKVVAVKSVLAKEKYIEGIGRRKASVARVRLYRGKEIGKGFDIIVNEKTYEKYFPLEKQRKVALAPFAATEENFRVTVLAKGGGLNAQAEAVRLGLSRALVKEKPDYRGKLKALGYLTRDSRTVERKKFGSRKARRPQQWRKR